MWWKVMSCSHAALMVTVIAVCLMNKWIQRIYESMRVKQCKIHNGA